MIRADRLDFKISISLRHESDAAEMFTSIKTSPGESQLEGWRGIFI